MFVHCLAVFFQRSPYRFLRSSIINFRSNNFHNLLKNNRFLMAPRKRAAATKTTSTPTESKADKKPTKKDDKKKQDSEKQIIQENGDAAVSSVPQGRTRGRQLKTNDNQSEANVVERRKAPKRGAAKDVEIENESPDVKQTKPTTPVKKPLKRGRSKKESDNTEILEKQESEPTEEEEEVGETDEKRPKTTRKTTKNQKEVVEKPETSKPAAKRTAKDKKKDVKKDETTAIVEETATTSETKEKRKGRGKKTDSEAPGSDENTLKNTTATKWNEINFKTTRTNAHNNSYNMHIQSWNVDGLRAWLKKGGLDILKYAQPDILCLQEIKCSLEKLPDEMKTIENYKPYWACCQNKEGYSGVGILTKIMPIEVHYGIDDEEFDDDGRCITAEFKYFYLINVYVPNAGRGLITLPKRLKWNQSFKNYINKLNAKKPIIVCGDMNVAHNEIDLTNPKANVKHAGFTIEEREGMTEFLKDGYIDTFRKFYPDQTGAYTFWTYLAKARSKNVGWRLDYYLVSERIMDNVCDNMIHSEVFGSDHCPISLYLNF